MAADFVPSGFFVLRTPLLPFDELERFDEGLEAGRSSQNAERLERALAHDSELLRERLRAIVARPAVRDALFVASPDLEAALDAWLAAPAGPRAEKLERALVRYFERMVGRATPFGLFAGCSVGRLAERTELVLEPSERNGRHSRLDQDYLDALLVALEADSDLRRELTFRPNSSLYPLGGQLRYAETRLDGRRRSRHLAAVERSEPLTVALDRAQDGATRAEVADAVAGGGVVSLEDAEEFADQLIDGQLLVPELGIPVTGREPLDLLADELAAHRSSGFVAARLSEVRDELVQIDAGGPGADPARYRKLADRLSELPAEVELRRLFQVDLYKPAPRATLGQEVVREILRGVELLHRIPPARPPSELQAFRERFAERFEQREVPLLEALDDDAGVGFPQPDPLGASPLLDGLTFPPEDKLEVSWGKRERFLLKKLMEAVERGEHSIELHERDVESLAIEDSPLPDAFAASAVIAAPSQEALDHGEFRVSLRGSAGPSGARLLGRFAHGAPDLRRQIEQHLRAEEALRGDAVFAEIVHLPEGRLGNIICRPVLREYEIPYLGRSGAPRERQIPVSDLMVSVVGHPMTSPLGESIVLRSRELGQRVLPRLTTAHNFSFRSIPVYRFLCLLQGQGRDGEAWDWGALSAAPFLPRVEAGRLVLSPARWRLDADELRALGQGDQLARFRAAQRMRERRRLPQLVGLADYDNVLPVDLENVLSIDAFVATLGDRDEASLVEMWPPRSELCAHGPEGRFVHEVVVPFVRKNPVSPANGAPGGRVHPAPAGPPRSLPPGSDWLYVKLYAGRTTADRVLPEVVAPLVDDVLGSGAADSWFFIRYADPHEHLRVRFRGDPRALREQVQPRIEAALGPLLRDGSAWRLSYDTYEREVERYGGPQAIESAERIFHADSDAVLGLLSMFESGDRGAEERWRMALCGASMLMADAGLDEHARVDLLERLRASFGSEFRVDRALARKLAERLREHRRELESLVVPGDDVAEELRPGVETLRVRTARVAPAFEELRTLEAAGKLAVTRTSLAASLVHMYVNRLVRSAPRAHELVLYDFLLRLYRARAARLA